MNQSAESNQTLLESTFLVIVAELFKEIDSVLPSQRVCDLTANDDENEIEFCECEDSMTVDSKLDSQFNKIGIIRIRKNKKHNLYWFEMHWTYMEAF